mmetsp:Transcript_8024/g.10203  ORF Transcript_8024/g.10203 Transcript_8024/m.10203 type:complete len:81 (-) Transcript_8024:1255-1497(-)
MTPYFEYDQHQPISRVSVAALKDLGYEVNMDAADPLFHQNSTLHRHLSDEHVILKPSKSFILSESNILRPAIQGSFKVGS